MSRINPWSFPAVPSSEEIARENELKPTALLKRIKKLEKEVKRLKKKLNDY